MTNQTRMYVLTSADNLAKSELVAAVCQSLFGMQDSELLSFVLTANFMGMSGQKATLDILLSRRNPDLNAVKVYQGLPPAPASGSSTLQDAPPARMLDGSLPPSSLDEMLRQQACLDEWLRQQASWLRPEKREASIKNPPPI